MKTVDAPPTPSNRFLSFRQAHETVCQGLSEGALRRLAFDHKLDSVIVRIGRRVLLDERKLVEWLRSQTIDA